jgi:hypothetical protein
MLTVGINKSCFISRITDLVVLAASYLLFSFMTGRLPTGELIINLLVYVSIVFVCLRLAKRLTFRYLPEAPRVVSILLGNIAGLMSGSLLVGIFCDLMPGVQEFFLAVLLSSVLAFFILGTLSPMIKSSRLDITHH